MRADDTTYDVIVESTGALTAAEASGRLAHVFGISRDRAELMLGALPATVRRGTTEAGAREYHRLLCEIGLNVRVSPPLLGIVDSAEAQGEDAFHLDHATDHSTAGDAGLELDYSGYPSGAPASGTGRWGGAEASAGSVGAVVTGAVGGGVQSAAQHDASFAPRHQSNPNAWDPVAGRARRTPPTPEVGKTSSGAPVAVVAALVVAAVVAGAVALTKSGDRSLGDSADAAVGGEARLRPDRVRSVDMLLPGASCLMARARVEGQDCVVRAQLHSDGVRVDSSRSGTEARVRMCTTATAGVTLSLVSSTACTVNWRPEIVSGIGGTTESMLAQFHAITELAAARPLGPEQTVDLGAGSATVVRAPALRSDCVALVAQGPPGTDVDAALLVDDVVRAVDVEPDNYPILEICQLVSGDVSAELAMYSGAGRVTYRWYDVARVSGLKYR